MRTSRRALIALTVSALLSVSACAGGDTLTAMSADAAPGAEAVALAADTVQIGPDLELADLLDDHGDVAVDVRWLIDALDALPLAERPDTLFASVRSDVVALSDGSGPEINALIPDGEFYVSIAPFATYTHDCYYHSLTTCVGELQGKDMHVLITDSDGAVILDEDVTTFDNGFIGLWLPAGIAGQITITAAAGTVTGPISTAADAPTCVTTLELT